MTFYDISNKKHSMIIYRFNGVLWSFMLSQGGGMGFDELVCKGALVHKYNLERNISLEANI